MMHWKTSAHKEYMRLILMSLLLLLPNLIVWSIAYPGFFQADHQNTIASLANGIYDEWHSLLWGFFAYPFIYLAPSYGVYGIVQIAIFVFAVMFCITKLQSLQIIGSRTAWVLATIFATAPTFLMYNMLYSSDVIFSVLLLPLTVMLIEICKTNGESLSRKSFVFGLCVLLYLVVELRKNSLLIFLFLGVLLLIKLRHFRKQVMIVLISTAMMLAGTSLIYSNVLHTVKSPSQELMSVPVQQIGRAVADGGDIPDEAVSVLEKIRPLDEWGSDYLVVNSDPLKFNNKHPDKEKVALSVEFITAWIQIGLKNPVSYLRAYLDFMNPYWQITADPASSYISTDFANHDVYTRITCGSGCRSDYIAQFDDEDSEGQKFIASVSEKIDGLHVPLLSDALNLLYFNRALPLWIFVAGAFLMLRKRMFFEYAVISSPLWCILLSLLVFSPVACFRYSLQMYYIIPVLVIWCISSRRNSKPDSLLHEEEKLNNGGE